jgi:hypothetical protein
MQSSTLSVRQLVAKNFSTGCSSIAFGATPVWPGGMSKKPTPVTVACH